MRVGSAGEPTPVKRSTFTRQMTAIGQTHGERVHAPKAPQGIRSQNSQQLALSRKRESNNYHLYALYRRVLAPLSRNMYGVGSHVDNTGK